MVARLVRLAALGVVVLAVAGAGLLAGSARSGNAPRPFRPLEISGGGLANLAMQEHPEWFRPGEVEPVVEAPPLGTTFEAFAFDDNITVNGAAIAPPDPSGAAGPNHVVNVVNSAIEWYTKDGTRQSRQSLSEFFASLPLPNGPFDPRAVYDQHAGRFVVSALVQKTGPRKSRILLGVSDDSDPNGTWHFQSIDSRMMVNGADSWADFTRLAVDEEAVYLASNMFGFSPQINTGERLWILDKTPLYSGGVVSFTVHDPFAETGLLCCVSFQPVQVYGAPPAGVGTWLVGYFDLHDGTDVYIAVIRVDDPLTAPSFHLDYIPWGTLAGSDNAEEPLPAAPQSGTAELIATNDRRVSATAVWRDDMLSFAATILPPTGVDAGQATAHWWQVDTTGLGIVIWDQGNVGGEEIAPGTFTFFPVVSVDEAGNLALGFSASAPSIFAGAYYTGRLAADPAGTTQPASVLRAGTDWYVRRAPRSRWGDYTGLWLDPADEQTFWVYNQYATTRGTPTMGEDGRWATAWGSFELDDGAPPVCSRTGGTLTIDMPAASAMTVGLAGSAFNVTGGGNPDPTCGGSTTANVENVVVDGATGDETLIVDLAGGPFNGGSPEGTGTAEIEFAIDLGAGLDSVVIDGGALKDVVRLGVAGVNANDDDDADWTLSGVSSVTVNGGDGADTLAASGGQGTGSAFPNSLVIHGDGGNDKLTGGSDDDLIHGDAGKDQFKEGKSADGADQLFGGAAQDTANYGARTCALAADDDDVADDGCGEGDNVHGDVERVYGGKQADTITLASTSSSKVKGNAGADTLSVVDGVSGNDTVDGDGGTDACSADAGDTQLDC